MRFSSVCSQALKHADRSQSIAFIGLGRMGAEMAFNLFSKSYASAKETHFAVCDALPESTASFADNFRKHFPGAKLSIVDTPAEAVVSSQTVITMLPSSPHVQSVYTESGGIIPALRSLSPTAARGTLCIDSTTLAVDVARKVASQVHDVGASMVDAPVSGGVIGAKAGTLSFLVGGTEAEFALASPVLARMAGRIIHCGDSGAGLAAKICNNLVLGVEQIVVAEAMLMGQKLGLNPRVLASVINSSTGSCWSSSINNPVPSALTDKSPPCERDYEGGFATSLMLKDLGLALESGDTTGSPLPLGDAAHRVYEDVIDQLPELARKDFSSVYKWLQEKNPKET